MISKKTTEQLVDACEQIYFELNALPREKVDRAQLLWVSIENALECVRFAQLQDRRNDDFENAMGTFSAMRNLEKELEPSVCTSEVVSERADAE